MCCKLQLIIITYNVTVKSEIKGKIKQSALRSHFKQLDIKK